MTVYMSFDYLRHTEAETVQEFQQASPMFEAIMPELLDTLFRLSYFIGDREPDAQDGFHYFARERFAQTPYSTRACWLLARIGYYPEAAILVRHLLETLVQLRFFAKYPERLLPHYTEVGGKNRISFRLMFEEFSPGYYDEHYRVLASAAHAGAGLSAFLAVENAPDGSGKVLMPAGCKFSEDRCSFIVNHTLMLTSGYLRLFPNWFPRYKSLVDSETETRRVEALSALDEWRRGHRAAFTHSEGWHDRSDRLFDANTAQ